MPCSALPTNTSYLSKGYSDYSGHKTSLVQARNIYILTLIVRRQKNQLGMVTVEITYPNLEEQG